MRPVIFLVLIIRQGREHAPVFAVVAVQIGAHIREVRRIARVGKDRAGSVDRAGVQMDQVVFVIFTLHDGEIDLRPFLNHPADHVLVDGAEAVKIHAVTQRALRHGADLRRFGGRRFRGFRGRRGRRFGRGRGGRPEHRIQRPFGRRRRGRRNRCCSRNRRCRRGAHRRRNRCCSRNRRCVQLGLLLFVENRQQRGVLLLDALLLDLSFNFFFGSFPGFFFGFFFDFLNFFGFFCFFFFDAPFFGAPLPTARLSGRDPRRRLDRLQRRLFDAVLRPFRLAVFPRHAVKARRHGAGHGDTERHRQQQQLFAARKGSFFLHPVFLALHQRDNPQPRLSLLNA